MMISRFDAAINGTWISEVDDSIIVTDVKEEKPRTRANTAEKAVGAGSRFIRNERESASVGVSFVIWEQDVQRRKEILQRVQEWAGASDVSHLEINDRAGQRLCVRCTEMPSMASSLNWQEQMHAVFTAYELPFWQDSEPSRAVITANGSLFVPGMGESLCDVEVTNNGSGAITTLTLVCGNTKLVFAGISLAAGKTLALSHDDLGLLSARIGNTSVLNKRTAESDDDLIAMCGQYNTITVSGGTVSAVFKARGVYL